MTLSGTCASIDGPFVLLDDGGAMARLYRDPVRVITAFELSEVQPAMEEVSRAGAAGLHAAGYLTYEAGIAFEARLSGLTDMKRRNGDPLLWFGLFRGLERVPASAIGTGTGDVPVSIGKPRPAIDRSDYGRRFAEAQEFIRAGDIYQVNLTFPCPIPLSGHPLAIYAAVRAQAGARHGGIVRTGQHWILSFSPELFFELKDGAMTCRPMKGTAARQADPAEDARAATDLASDPKQRAENLMIVDLLRNDMARIAQPGSVAIDRLFEVETYPTIHQLTSTITARMIDGLARHDVFRAIYPCGSITGAPKIRAMEIIAALEQEPRGIYTGAIGAVGPDGEASFNVAIRTLELQEGDNFARLGLGSGVVADSQVDDEWNECLTKARFLSGLQAVQPDALTV